MKAILILAYFHQKIEMHSENSATFLIQEKSIEFLNHDSKR